jgi:hypothetical protein
MRPNQKLPSAKKITRETLRENPLLAAIARMRAKALRDAKRDGLGPRQNDLFERER